MNRDDVGVMIFPRIDDCRRLAGAAPDADVQAVLRAPAVRAFFAELLARLNRDATGSATLITRLRILDEPPSLDLGEVTDKGSINQRAVLAHRAALVEAMYAADARDDAEAGLIFADIERIARHG
jgi:feruloyl-CoA synthase